MVIWTFRKLWYNAKFTQGQAWGFYFRSAKVKRTCIKAEHLPFVTMPTTWQTNISFSFDTRSFSAHKKMKKISRASIKSQPNVVIRNYEYIVTSGATSKCIFIILNYLHFFFFLWRNLSTFRVTTLHNLLHLTMYSIRYRRRCAFYKFSSCTF